MRKLAKDYFLSPIFVSIVLGLVLSHMRCSGGNAFCGHDHGSLEDDAGRPGRPLGRHSRASAFLSADERILKIDCGFYPDSDAVSAVVQQFCSGLLSVSAENRQILILISAMPAAILAPSLPPDTTAPRKQPRCLHLPISLSVR